MRLGAGPEAFRPEPRHGFDTLCACIVSGLANAAGSIRAPMFYPGKPFMKFATLLFAHYPWDLGLNLVLSQGGLVVESFVIFLIMCYFERMPIRWCVS